MSTAQEPLGPLDEAPRNIRPPFDQHRPDIGDLGTERWRELRRADAVAAIREPLAGIDLGTYDERIIEWLAHDYTPTIGAIVSLLYRARQAGRDEATR
ncbi:hypothetical protein [Pseudonocardia nigra]|uniref:hypothetical protein n=1 Tax=Pseudonocardia nigra TaxID=1921578 RepID=UPI001C5D07BD|nr:hypothetical protein [Pseudonocardia nigra]